MLALTFSALDLVGDVSPPAALLAPPGRNPAARAPPGLNPPGRNPPDDGEGDMFGFGTVVVVVSVVAAELVAVVVVSLSFCGVVAGLAAGGAADAAACNLARNSSSALIRAAFSSASLRWRSSN